jgi:vitamin D 25-hydroxylase
LTLDKQLAWLCFEFFAAGMDTTSTVLTWSMLYMALHQDVQRRVRAEISEKLGADRQPSYSDRTRMRYTEAVLNEVMRFCANSPMALPHRATRDVRVRDWLLPKDTLVMSNIYAAHRQPDIWPDPEHFNPEANFTRRNASTGELEYCNAEYIIPFSQGKRQCVGEALARQELFIFFAGILQRYRIVPHPAHPLPAENEFVFHGLGRNSKPFHVLFVKEALE